jgi:O-antigen/teichoic acid export membrane protein
LGIIQRQATRNAVSIFLATIIGAVNTIVVLPAAFDTYEEGWGLLKVIVAYAMIFSQFIHGGIPNAFLRFLPSVSGADRSLFLGRLMLAPTAGTLFFLGLVIFFGETGFQLINADESKLLIAHIPELFVLTTALTFFQVFGGYLGAQLKSTLYQFLNETFLKSWYLVVVVGFWMELYGFDVLLWAYVAGYVIAMLVTLISARKNAFHLKFEGRFPLKVKEVATYSFYAILDRGAAIAVTNLDIVMIGLLASLEEVAFYTLAFYIGSVALLPQKSISAISMPVVSASIAANEITKLTEVYVKSSLMQLTLGGLIFCCIWVPIDEIMQLLPDKFSGGKWVVFFIGIAKLLQMAGGVSGGILVYSKYYRSNFYLNLLLIVLTIATNLFFMHPDGLNMGITGAALATAISATVYTGLKVYYVQRYFKINPFSRSLLIASLLIAVISSLVLIPNLFGNIYLSLLMKGSVTALLFLSVARSARLLPELKQFLGR